MEKRCEGMWGETLKDIGVEVRNVTPIGETTIGVTMGGLREVTKEVIASVELRERESGKIVEVLVGSDGGGKVRWLRGEVNGMPVVVTSPPALEGKYWDLCIASAAKLYLALYIPHIFEALMGRRFDLLDWNRYVVCYFFENLYKHVIGVEGKDPFRYALTGINLVNGIMIEMKENPPAACIFTTFELTFSPKKIEYPTPHIAPPHITLCVQTGIYHSHYWQDTCLFIKTALKTHNGEMEELCEGYLPSHRLPRKKHLPHPSKVLPKRHFRHIIRKVNKWMRGYLRKQTKAKENSEILSHPLGLGGAGLSLG